MSPEACHLTCLISLQARKAEQLPIALKFAERSVAKRAFAMWKSSHATLLQENSVKILTAQQFMASQSTGAPLFLIYLQMRQP